MDVLILIMFKQELAQDSLLVILLGLIFQMACIHHFKGLHKLKERMLNMLYPLIHFKQEHH